MTDSEYTWASRFVSQRFCSSVDPACTPAGMFVAVVHFELLSFIPAIHGRLQCGAVGRIDAGQPFSCEQLLIGVDAKDVVTFARPLIQVLNRIPFPTADAPGCLRQPKAGFALAEFFLGLFPGDDRIFQYLENPHPKVNDCCDQKKSANCEYPVSLIHPGNGSSDRMWREQQAWNREYSKNRSSAPQECQGASPGTQNNYEGIEDRNVQVGRNGHVDGKYKQTECKD